MKRVLLVLLGTVLGYVAMVVAIYAWGLIAVWSPFPRSMWASHGSFVTTASAGLAFAPFVALLVFALVALFKEHAVANSTISMGFVTLIGNAPGSHSPGELLASITDAWWLTAIFLIGVPLLVWLLQTLRSNQRLERP